MTLEMNRDWAFFFSYQNIINLNLGNRFSQLMPYTEEAAVVETHCSGCGRVKKSLMHGFSTSSVPI